MKDLKMKGLESKDGRVKLFDERVVFIPPNIISLLGQIYGEGSKPLLKYLGKKMGRRLIETWEDHLRPKTLDQLVDIFLDMVSVSGWGIFSVLREETSEEDAIFSKLGQIYGEKEEISEDKIVVKLNYNISREEGSFRDICNFICGLLTGFGEFALYSAQVTEIKCSVVDPNEDSCVFLIEKREIEI